MSSGDVRVQCPYCFQVIDLSLDPETRGVTIQDCEVCCRPWQLTVKHRKRDGRLLVRVERAQ
jgi:hypothetical protein